MASIMEPVVGILLPFVLAAASGEDVQARLDASARARRPLIAHIVVALADNDHQGLIPVSKLLGNGQDPANNLYWGARFGLRTYFSGAGWEPVRAEGTLPEHVLERAVLRTRLARRGVAGTVQVFVVADAYDGRFMREALTAFFAYSAGRQASKVRAGSLELEAGGDASLVGFVGHDGLMDLSLDGAPVALPGAPARSAVALACSSRPFMSPLLTQAGAHVLIVTTGLMAPEAYTLDAVLRSTFGGESAKATREAAAVAYDRFQKCGLRGARHLFTGGD